MIGWSTRLFSVRATYRKNARGHAFGSPLRPGGDGRAPGCLSVGLASPAPRGRARARRASFAAQCSASGTTATEDDVAESARGREAALLDRISTGYGGGGEGGGVLSAADEARLDYWAGVAAEWALVNKQTDEVYEELEEVFGCKNGYTIPDTERDEVDATGGSAAYGELEETDELLRLLDMGPEDTFVDLGSGRGRVVLHAALKTDVGAAWGVELSKLRHIHAEDAYYEMEKRGYLLGERVQLACADFMEGDYIERATHVFMCNTCYTEALSARVAERCMRSPAFRVMVTTRELPYQPWLRKVGEYVQEYSWTGSGRSYVYARELEEVPAPLLAKLFCPAGNACLPVNGADSLAVAPLEGEDWVTAGSFRTLQGFRLNAREEGGGTAADQ